MGANQAGQARQYRATATIWQPAIPPNSVSEDSPEEPNPLNPSAAEQEVLSDQNVDGALLQVAGKAGQVSQTPSAAGAVQSIEQVRQNLQVTAVQMPDGQRLRISLSYCDRNPDRAVHLVNALARGYAEQHRPEADATALGDYFAAREAAERTRQEYFEAQGRFDDFIEQHFLRQQALAERAAERAAERRSAYRARSRPEAEPSVPRVTVNPERLEAEKQLAELEQRRALLLTSRTQLHPEVQDIDLRIAQVKERLASIPGQIPDQRLDVPQADGGLALGSPPGESLPGTPDESVTDTPDEVPPDNADDDLPGLNADQYTEAVQAFHAHKSALDHAREEYDRLSEIKRRAWERQLRGPAIELELAETCEALPSADRAARPLMAALAAALAVAMGVGLISSGFDTDLPITTLAEAQEALPVPVLGAIPASGPQSARSPTRQIRPAGGLAKIISGTLLIAVCFGVLVIVL